MPASLQAQVLVVWGQVLVSLQLKCARGMLAGSGGCPSPAPCTASQRHTQTHIACSPKPWMGQALGLAPPPNRQREALDLGPTLIQRSYALVVLFMPVSRTLHLTQWGKWCLKQQQNKQTNQQTRCIQLESRVLAKREGKDVNGQHSSWNW